MISRFDIHKIDCQSCVIMIESICEEFPGVKKAEVRARQRELILDHESSVDVAKLQQQLADGGYNVTPRQTA